MTALNDISVLDFSVARAGPTAVRQFADWGAQVIRIEPRVAGGEMTGTHLTADYINLHRSKRVLTLDLKHPDSAAIVSRLIARSDLLVENFRPPVKERLGISYAAAAAINPAIIYGSISGFGQTGPYAERGSVDQIIQGMSGLMSVTGTDREAPVRTGIAIADMAAGHQLAIGMLIALHNRDRTGLGEWVKVSLIEAMISFLDFQAARWTVDGGVPEPEGNNHPTAPATGTFLAADGHLNIAAGGERMWSRLCDVLELDAVRADPRFVDDAARYAHRSELNEILAEALHRRSRADWIERLDAVGVPSGPVYRMDEAFADPQVAYLQMSALVEHPVRGSVGVLRQPVTMQRTPSVAPTSSPMPSQHTTEILGEIGYSTSEIADFYERQVV